MPAASSSSAKKFLTWRLRSASIAGSSVGPSTPQFQLRLSSEPSRLFSPLASLCFSVVRDEIVEREAVVTGHEIDALLGLALLVAVDVGAAQQPSGHARHRAVVAFQETPDVVAEPAVPFLPGVADEAADLIEPGGIPRLGDQLGAGEQRIRLDVPEDRRVGQRATRPRRATGSTRDRSGSRRRASG